MTAMEVIESGDVQAAAAYGQVLNEVNEWVEMYNIKQSTKVTEQMIEERDEHIKLSTTDIDRNNRIEVDTQDDL